MRSLVEDEALRGESVGQALWRKRIRAANKPVSPTLNSEVAERIRDQGKSPRKIRGFEHRAGKSLSQWLASVRKGCKAKKEGAAHTLLNHANTASQRPFGASGLNLHVRGSPWSRSCRKYQDFQTCIPHSFQASFHRENVPRDRFWAPITVVHKSNFLFWLQWNLTR